MILKKNWGFYISQSINSRVKKEGFKIVLVKIFIISII